MDVQNEAWGRGRRRRLTIPLSCTGAAHVNGGKMERVHATHLVRASQEAKILADIAAASAAHAADASGALPALCANGVRSESGRKRGRATHGPSLALGPQTPPQLTISMLRSQLECSSRPLMCKWSRDGCVTVAVTVEPKDALMGESL